MGFLMCIRQRESYPIDSFCLVLSRFPSEWRLMPGLSIDSEIEAMAERAKRYPYGATWPGCGLSPDSPLWPPSRFYGGHMVASGLTIGKAGQGHWDPLNFFLPVANRTLAIRVCSHVDP